MSLKRERERLSKTITDVMEICDASKSSVIRWEQGKPIPSDKLDRLDRAGFDIRYVVTGVRNETVLQLLPAGMQEEMLESSRRHGWSVEAELAERLKAAYSVVAGNVQKLVSLAEEKLKEEVDSELLERCWKALSVAQLEVPSVGLSKDEEVEALVRLYRSRKGPGTDSDVSDAALGLISKSSA